MKILTGIDLPFLPNCGSMIICNDIYSKLEDTHFIALKPPENEKKKWSDLKNVHLLDIDKSNLSQIEYEHQLTKAVLKLVDKIKPDIIHIQHLSFGLAKAFSHPFIDVPKIAICHGTGVLFALEDETHLKNIVRTCSVSEKVIFPTKGMLDGFEEVVTYDRINSKKEIIHWGLPDYVFKTRDFMNFPATKKLIYAGRITKNKGVDLILYALSKLPDDFVLTIIGEGPEEQELREIVKNLCLESRVEFLPFANRKELWRAFDLHNTLIIPTKEVEAFGIVAIEAQARGIPVIHSDLPTFNELLKNGAIAFEANSVEDLVEKIKTSFENKNLFIDRSINAFLNARNFLLTNSISKLESISYEVLASVNQYQSSRVA